MVTNSYILVTIIDKYKRYVLIYIYISATESTIKIAHWAYNWQYTEQPKNCKGCVEKHRRSCDTPNDKPPFFFIKKRYAK